MMTIMTMDVIGEAYGKERLEDFFQSCPLNTVPQPVIDEYLKKNDVMKKAWEKSGWQID